MEGGCSGGAIASEIKAMQGVGGQFIIELKSLCENRWEGKR